MRSATLTAVAILTVFVLCAGCSGDPPRQHYEEAGGFSYDPPPGWQVAEFPGLKYRITHGPRENEFAPNINVVDERFPGSLSAYVDANLRSMEQVFPNLTVLDRADFETRDGEAAVRILTENEQQGMLLRQTFYFLGSGSRKYVVTCSALAAGGDELDSTFSASLETFRIH